MNLRHVAVPLITVKAVEASGETNSVYSFDSLACAEQVFNGFSKEPRYQHLNWFLFEANATEPSNWHCPARKP